MNITVHERIKTIMVNMERSRWLSHDYTKRSYSGGEHSIIYANLFQGKQACTRIQSSSRKSMNKTAVGSNDLKSLLECSIKYFKKRNFTSYRKKKQLLSKTRHGMGGTSR
jgi:hypothetical protein